MGLNHQSMALLTNHQDTVFGTFLATSSFHSSRVTLENTHQIGTAFHPPDSSKGARTVCEYASQKVPSP